MLRISQIFKLINIFYRQANFTLKQVKEGQNAGYFMPDDPEESENNKYQELTNVARQVDDPNFASELMLIAEMYKKATEINAGYNSINKAISNFINMYLEDEDDEQQQAIEDVLNDVVKDLRTKAGGGAALSKPDSPEIIAQLKAVKDRYNAEIVQEEVDDLSKYEESAAPVFDPTGGISFEESRKGPGRGYSVRSKRSPKDWAESFENEKMRYVDALLTATGHIKEKFKKLIEVLDKLKNNALAENSLDPEQTDKLEQLREYNRNLRKEREILKSRIRIYELSHLSNKLEDDLKETTNPIDKLRLQQEIELYKLMSGRDVNKGDEIYWRRLLIKSMSGGNVPSPETIKNMLNRIEEAAKKKITAEEWRKKHSLQKREKIEKGTLDGLLIDLGVKLATRKSTVKQTIIDKLNAAEHTIFQPYLDKIIAGKNSGNEKAVKDAVKELNVVIKEFAETQPEVIASVELSKEFYKFRDQVKTLDKTKVLEREGTLPDEIKNIVLSMIEEGKDLVNRFSNVERFTPIIKSMKEIIKLLEGKYHE